MHDTDCVAFLQWALAQLRLRWPGFRNVRKQVSQRLHEGGVLVIGRHEQLPAGVPGLQPWLPQFGFYRQRHNINGTNHAGRFTTSSIY